MEHVFTKCGVGAVDMPGPDGSPMKCVIIEEHRKDGDTYRMPLPLEVAESLAKELTSKPMIRPSAVEVAKVNGSKRN